MNLLDRIAEVSARLHGLGGFPLVDGGPIRLRPPRDEDVEPLFQQFSHPEVMRYWSRAPMRDQREAADYIADIRNGFAKRELLNWIVADPDSDAMLGTCTLYDIQLRHLRAGVGYALHPRHQGRGYATEAVALACAWAFNWLGLHRVEADIHPDNAASRRVLVRCGFRREGLLRQRFVTADEIQDSEIYGRLADDLESS